MEDILGLALRVNDFLSGIMFSIGIKLIDFKLKLVVSFTESIKDF